VSASRDFRSRRSRSSSARCSTAHRSGLRLRDRANVASASMRKWSSPFSCSARRTHDQGGSRGDGRARLSPTRSAPRDPKMRTTSGRCCCNQRQQERTAKRRHTARSALSSTLAPFRGELRRALAERKAITQARIFFFRHVCAPLPARRARLGRNKFDTLRRRDASAFFTALALTRCPGHQGTSLA
jgi:hypothetical protein